VAKESFHIKRTFGTRMSRNHAKGAKVFWPKKFSH